MIMDPIRAVIFDFDGLLMDTESISLAAWEREWACWGLALDRDQFFAPHGGDVTEERYERLAAAVGQSFDRDLSHRRRTADRDAMLEQLTLAAGIESWLEQVGASGLRTAVASSSPVAWVHRHLRRIDALKAFELVTCGDEVAQHKPAPDVYELALRRLGISGDQAIAVEDTPHGVDAAHAAGMACIAIPNPFVDRAMVAHAELVLDSAIDTSLADAMIMASNR